MSNYLFLRGNRNKRFFLDVAKELNKMGHKSFQLKFELGELLFKSDIESVFVPTKLSSQAYPVTDAEILNMPIYNITYKKRFLNKETSQKELHLYKRYMFYIDQFIEEHNIDIICLFNGYHWIDQITKHLADKKGLKTYYFEDGLFRPFTITCDPKGINANSSVPEDPTFYDSLEINEDRLSRYLYKPQFVQYRKGIKESLLKVASVKAISMMGSFLRIHPSFYAHITLWQASKYFIHKKIFQYRSPDKVDIPKDYLFLPFQVSRDTQILYNSDKISTMEELLDHVYSAVQTYNRENNKQMKIVVKEHPEDISRNNYTELKKRYKNVNNVIFLQKYDIKTLIKNAKIIVTINSTVGIEALAMSKPVITLGEAFYNIEGIVYRCKDPEFLGDYITKALKIPLNIDRMKKFIYYLRFFYQIEGSINHVNKQTAMNVAKRIG
ncbi:hypothetical protein [Bacillus sp. J37]|uniref:capsular polysaccharide export protein, LipB/KpsS family n=1 Tax=Bacillus sp. J37 TaxID=935837 RepID=UPI00047D0845|nr:hypothetical protein [Bacillus sp. J37]